MIVTPVNLLERNKMPIDFDRIDFLEFFDDEDIVEEGKIIKFLYFTKELKFTLCLFINENIATIELEEKESSHRFFKISMNDIAKISCNKTDLFFYKIKEIGIDLYSPDFNILVKPRVLLQLELK